MINAFQTQDINKRKEISSKYLTQYPDMVPIIVETTLGILKKNKYLVPRYLTLSAFLATIRKNVDPIASKQTLFLFINQTLIPMTATMGTIYEKKKHEDGFLYITCSGENTFGSK